MPHKEIRMGFDIGRINYLFKVVWRVFPDSTVGSIIRVSCECRPNLETHSEARMFVAHLAAVLVYRGVHGGTAVHQ
jgi:hypothetical protein